MSAHAEIDEQIERLYNGNTLRENEVKELCEKVRRRDETTSPNGSQPHIDIIDNGFFLFHMVRKGYGKAFPEDENHDDCYSFSLSVARV